MSQLRHRDVFAELGLTRIINVSGTETAYGAAPVCEEVLAAVSALAPSWVDMQQLQQAASGEIAAAFGSEAGLVAHCSAAGLAMATAGCMTGENLTRIHQLPDTAMLRHRVILQRGHDIDYGAPLRQNLLLTGATIVEVGTVAGCQPEDLMTAIDAQTAAAIYVVSHQTTSNGMLDLSTFCRVCRDREVPVIVDAAAEPDPRVFLAAGAELVITSVHKRFAGLTSAIVMGKSALVRACLAQEKGIGRPMKAGKEAVIGTLAAIDRWRRMDHGAERAALESRLARAESMLARLPGLRASIVRDTTSGAFSRIHLEMRPGVAPSARELAARLREGSPAIIVREGPDSYLLQLDLRLVSDTLADIVVAEIARVVSDPEYRHR